MLILLVLWFHVYELNYAKKKKYFNPKHFDLEFVQF